MKYLVCVVVGFFSFSLELNEKIDPENKKKTVKRKTELNTIHLIQCIRQRNEPIVFIIFILYFIFVKRLTN